jgi:hypothetical protein
MNFNLEWPIAGCGGRGVLVVQCNDEVAGWMTLVRFPVELGTSSTLSRASTLVDKNLV